MAPTLTACHMLPYLPPTVTEVRPQIGCSIMPSSLLICKGLEEEWPLSCPPCPLLTSQSLPGELHIAGILLKASKGTNKSSGFSGDVCTHTSSARKGKILMSMLKEAETAGMWLQLGICR